MTILDEILEHKRGELRAAVARVSAEEMAARAESLREPCRGLRRALLACEPPAVIAELKRRSPSRGEIRADFDPADCARRYAGAGAAALSVLTDAHYFGGDLAHLRAARAAVALPVLRKDFVVDAYQIDEARVAGADAVLLIVAALPTERLATLHKRARELGLDVLVEVHDEAEAEVAAEIGAELVGVNNRDLRSFAVDLSVTERLARHPGLAARMAEGAVLVAESGIHTSEDIRRLEAAGARAFLVGESLMREPDPGQALRRLRRSP